MMTRCFAFGLAASVTVAPAQANTLYTIDAVLDTLVRIDISDINNPVTSTVGPIGVPFRFGGLAWDAGSETLYMTDGRTNNSLFTIDLDTGAATLVGRHGLVDLFGLAWDASTDTLYATQGSIGGQGLYTLSQSDGSATQINFDIGTDGEGLAYDSTRDRLLLEEAGAGDLYEVNRATGETTLRFDGEFVNNSGLAYDPNNDVFWSIDFDSNLRRYELDGGVSRVDVAVIPGLQFGSLAFVPEPTSLGLLSLGGLAFMARRRRA